METVLGLQAWNNCLPGCVLTIGNFDGVHLGHQSLLRQVKKRASGLGLPSVVLTFDPHPSKVLKPDHAVPRLFSIEDLIEQIDLCDLDYLIIEKFTRDFANLSAESFLDQYLTPKLHPKAIIVGHDFAFGKNREGSFSVLQSLAKERQIEIVKLNPIQDDSAVISSTRIRELLSEGQVELAQRCLGRHYSILGVIVSGEGRGKKLGYATANMSTDAEVIPARGVYITELVVNGQHWPAVTNIGVKPTFHEKYEQSIETHVLVGPVNLSGEKVKLLFLQRLRSELKFSSAHELMNQIGQDVQRAKEFFGI